MAFDSKITDYNRNNPFLVVLKYIKSDMLQMELLLIKKLIICGMVVCATAIFALLCDLLFNITYPVILAIVYSMFIPSAIIYIKDINHNKEYIEINNIIHTEISEWKIINNEQTYELTRRCERLYGQYTLMNKMCNGFAIAYGVLYIGLFILNIIINAIS